MIRHIAISQVLILGVLCVAVSPERAGAQAPEHVITEAGRRAILDTAAAQTTEQIEETRGNAEAGNVDAQLVMALVYQQGRIVGKDLDAARGWFRKAAEQRHPMALNSLGLLYAQGEGVERNETEAINYFRQAADLGYAQAQSHLGWAYYTGSGVVKDPTEAVRWFRAAADQGNASAQNRLGVAYAQGQGVERNDVQAVAWYRKAADQGDAVAQLNLAQQYNYGSGVQKDFTQAARWYRAAAEQGHPRAQFDLAMAYHNGEGVPKNKDEAERWLKKASDQGDGAASFYIGKMYADGERGRGFLMTQIAMEYFEKAAREGYALGAVELGAMNASALRGVPRDDRKAYTWFLIAADLHQHDKSGPLRPWDAEAVSKELPKRLSNARKNLSQTEATACEQDAAKWLASRR